MESVYQEKSKFRMSKRKIFALTLSLFAVAIIVSEPAYASVPWWVSGIGAVAGGIVGSLTGSPIGTIAGAAAGAMIADYLYSITHKTGNTPKYCPNQQLIEDEFASSYENLTTQELLNDNNSATTTSELFLEDYYYNAQQQEAIVPYFLGNSSLNEFNISLAAGTYATINNISDSMYSPEDTVLFQTWYDSMSSFNNGFTGNQSGQKYSACSGDQYILNGVLLNGVQIVSGDYVFISPQNISTSIFRYSIGNVFLNVSNFYTGHTYNISSKGILPIDTYSIPYGLYKVNSASQYLMTSGIEILPSGLLDTTYFSGITSELSAPAASSVSLASGLGWNMVFANESVFASSKMSNSFGTKSSAYDGQSIGLFTPKNNFCGMTDYYTTFANNLNDIFSSAESYFTQLHSLGFTNINQLPAKDIIPFPSDVVPSSMLNDTFNEQELLMLYDAYMNDLNNTFHNASLFNGKNFTKYVNQTMFVNGFLTEYGNLTYTVGTTKHYVNQTDFFIQTYTDKLHFVKGQTTNLTGEIYPVLILNGTQNGTLLYVDASIYVIGLTLAGKSISSYTLQPEQITYVLPQTVNVGAPNTNGFLTSASNFLDKYYLYVAVIIVSALVIFVYSESRKNAGKGKE